MSPNFDQRPEGTKIDTIVLHYTGMKTGKDALERLCDPKYKVSSHYFIDEDGSTLELVQPKFRAWHAGKSIWRGRENVNDSSIGIEIVNPGHEFGYREFPKAQMDAVIALCKKLKKNFPIEDRNIIAHSDIAPARKQDPGELFDWKLLAKNSIGLWPDVTEENPRPLLKRDDKGQAVQELQENLARFGYGIVDDGIFEEHTEFVVQAFQRHFGQTKNINGVWDSGLESCLQKLLTC